MQELLDFYIRNQETWKSINSNNSFFAIEDGKDIILSLQDTEDQYEEIYKWSIWCFCELTYLFRDWTESKYKSNILSESIQKQKKIGNLPKELPILSKHLKDGKNVEMDKRELTEAEQELVKLFDERGESPTEINDISGS